MRFLPNCLPPLAAHVGALVFLALLLARSGHAAPTVTADPGFALDTLPRSVEPTGRVRCPKVDLVTYRGDLVRMHTPVRVNVDFRERLRRFEAVLRDVAIEVYGRAPARIHHLGALNCRRIRTWPAFLSEHGLGNAIDVAGFDFKSAPRRHALPAGVPPALRRGFRVRLAEHWGATDGSAALHARFLHLLAERLVPRHDIFRVMLGPAYPGHQDHFHFDCAPWRLVEIWSDASADVPAAAP